MQEAAEPEAVFISYAWGSGLEHKEWVRQRIVSNLDWKYQVFWDRDSIGFGQSIDRAIAKALAQRPIWVLCLCDEDYLAAAERPGSGLHRELQMLEQMADEPGVSIVPLILGEGCAQGLPQPLAGRLYLDLQPLHQRGIDLGGVLLGLLDGATQAQLHGWIQATIAKVQLRDRLRAYLQRDPVSFWGNARTHEVTVRSASRHAPLLAPQWMWQSEEWGYMLGDENPTYCPSKGRWHWDHFTPSRGMRALGTAMLSGFFPDALNAQSALSGAGTRLAVNFLCTVKMTEAFSFDGDDLISFMLNDPQAAEYLEQLLDTL